MYSTLSQSSVQTFLLVTDLPGMVRIFQTQLDFMQIWRLLISINWISLTKEINPITRKSVSKLVTRPSFIAWPNTRNCRHLKNPKIRDKCTAIRHGQTDHTFVSYFRVFQMSTISRVFGLQLWNLAALLILHSAFFVFDATQLKRQKIWHLFCNSHSVECFFLVIVICCLSAIKIKDYLH